MSTSSTVPRARQMNRLALGAALLAAAPAVRAANLFWADAAGQTTWSNNASWSTNIAPANSTVTDVAIFTTVANAQPNLTATRSVAGIDFQLPDGGAAFTSGAGVILTLGGTGLDATTQLAGTSEVSVETIKIGASQTWTLFSAAASASNSVFTVNSNIDINGQNLQINSARTSTNPTNPPATGGVGVVNLNGVLSGNANGSFGGLQLYGGGFRNTINLTNANTYTGNTLIRAVVVVANSLANAGTPSALGASGDIIVGNNATTTVLSFNNLAADSATDRRIQFQGTGSPTNYTLSNNSATGAVSFNNAGDIGSAASATTNSLNIRFAGTNTRLNTFGQIINNRANSGVTNVLKQEAGTWALTGVNTYTGTTTVDGGTLLINGNNGAAIGAVNVSGSAILGGVGTVGGAVTLTGASRLAPGSGGIGRLTLNNGLNVNVALGGGLDFEIGGSGGVKGVDFDSLVVTAGSVSIGADAALTIVAVNGFNLGQPGAYDLYDFSSAPTGNFGGVTITGSALAYDGILGLWTGGSEALGAAFTFNQLDGVLTVSAIPEPAGFAALAGLAGLGVTALRRRPRAAKSL